MGRVNHSNKINYVVICIVYNVLCMGIANKLHKIGRADMCSVQQEETSHKSCLKVLES